MATNTDELLARLQEIIASSVRLENDITTRQSQAPAILSESEKRQNLPLIGTIMGNLDQTPSRNEKLREETEAAAVQLFATFKRRVQVEARSALTRRLRETWNHEMLDGLSSDWSSRLDSNSANLDLPVIDGLLPDTTIDPRELVTRSPQQETSQPIDNHQHVQDQGTRELPGSAGGLGLMSSQVDAANKSLPNFQQTTQNSSTSMKRRAATDLRTPKKRRRVKESIDFDEVYQDGQPQHRIVTTSSNHESQYFIYKCREHDSFFHSKDPRRTGVHHLRRKHGTAFLSRATFKTVHRLFSIEVQNCTDELARKNNEAFDKNVLVESITPETHGQDVEADLLLSDATESRQSTWDLGAIDEATSHSNIDPTTGAYTTETCNNEREVMKEVAVVADRLDEDCYIVNESQMITSRTPLESQRLDRHRMADPQRATATSNTQSALGGGCVGRSDSVPTNEGMEEGKNVRMKGTCAGAEDDPNRGGIARDTAVDRSSGTMSREAAMALDSPPFSAFDLRRFGNIDGSEQGQEAGSAPMGDMPAPVARM